MIADKLKIGDEIRVLAPARSLTIINDESKQIAINNLKNMGFIVSFSKNCSEIDEFNSSSIKSRISDLHEAFLDKNVKAILTVIGGYNSNQLLDSIDYEIIKNNPKIVCGYSDITVLNNAIYKMTNLTTYMGPHFSLFGMVKGLEYTKDYFKKCLMGESDFVVEPSKQWCDDAWFLDQGNRVFFENEGYEVINEGVARGIIVGGNLCTFNLLHGTRYMPDLENKILFIEDDSLSSPETFDRDLQSLMHQPNFDKVKGIVIGKFQIDMNITRENLYKIIKTQSAFNNIPVITEANFGHTNPRITFPIGGEAEIIAEKNSAKIIIRKH